MAKNPAIEEYLKHIKQNSLDGDPATILVAVLEELAKLREDHDVLIQRVKKLEK